MFNVKYLHIALVADATSIHGVSVNNCSYYMYKLLFFGMWQIFSPIYLSIYNHVLS
jgi:hypothetical protein